MEITRENAKRLQKVLTQLDRLKKARNEIKDRIDFGFTEAENERPWEEQSTELQHAWMNLYIINSKIDWYLNGLQDGGLITKEEARELSLNAYSHKDEDEE